MNKKSLLSHFALGLILALGAFFRLYELGAYSIGNSYYAAAVKSMLLSWHNFFYVAFEPGASVSVDKPPLGFWIESLSAYFLGVNGFALALPNALAGIGSIILVYNLIRKSFGQFAALIAALALALTPVTVSTERNNTIDGMLIFFLLLALHAAWKAVRSGKFRYLLLGALTIGLAFNIKMLQAYMILPAFYGLYFFGSKENLRTRLWHLGTATLLLVGVSLSWALIVDLTPPEKRPFVGSSQNNTVLELIIGHNGLSRLGLNNKGKPAAPPPPPENKTPPQAAFDACASLEAGASCTLRAPEKPVLHGVCRPLPQTERFFCAPPPPNPAASFAAPAASNIEHNETGKAGLSRLFNEPLVTEVSWLLPAAFGGIVLGFFFLRDKNQRLALLVWTLWLLPMTAYFSFTTGLFHRYYLIMLGPAIAALNGIAFAVLRQILSEAPRLGNFLTLLFLLPTLFLQQKMLNGYPQTNALTLILFGCVLLGLILLLRETALKHNSRLKTTALALIAAGMLAAPFTWSGHVILDENPNTALPSASLHNQLPTSALPPDQSAQEKALTAFLLANTDPNSYLLATVNARDAAPYILATGRPVLTFGGFVGSDRIIDTSGVAEMVKNGELRYILLTKNIDNAHRDLAFWVVTTCQPTNVIGMPLPPKTSPPPPGAPPKRQPPQPPILYDCKN